MWYRTKKVVDQKLSSLMVGGWAFDRSLICAFYVTSGAEGKIFPLRLPFLIALTREEDIGTRSGRAGPSFSVRPEKEAKGAVLHGTSAAERWRHVETRSAGRTKTRCLTALKQFVRPFFHRAKRGEKIPSRATQIVAAGAASAFRKRPAAHKDAGSEIDQNHACLCTFSSLRLDRQAEARRV